MGTVLTIGESLIYAASMAVLLTALVALIWSLIKDLMKGE